MDRRDQHLDLADRRLWAEGGRGTGSAGAGGGDGSTTCGAANFVNGASSSTNGDGAGRSMNGGGADAVSCGDPGRVASMNSSVMNEAGSSGGSAAAGVAAVIGAVGSGRAPRGSAFGVGRRAGFPEAPVVPAR